MSEKKPKPNNGLNVVCPVVLENEPDSDYALLDSGDGLKLEQYGKVRVVRPEGQALWKPELSSKDWERADAVFTGDTSEEGPGRWRFKDPNQGETWPLSWDGIPYQGRFTSFRHVGVFPEQAAHWRFAMERIAAHKANGEPFKLLNLFGYTGLASLVAARAGAYVTHIDASKKAIGWARENQTAAGLEGKPIRWICEDAVRFCERELRRGNKYDGILLDPPKYGRGPKGEKWQFFDDLPKMMPVIEGISKPENGFVVLTAYSIRASFFAIHEIMRDTFSNRKGTLESGELVLKTRASDRRLSTSLFSRWYA